MLKHYFDNNRHGDVRVIKSGVASSSGNKHPGKPKFILQILVLVLSQ